MNARSALAVAAFCLFLLSSGCGGGGGTSSPATPTKTLRAPQFGQTWSYSVAGEITNSSGTNPLTGSLAESFGTTLPAGGFGLVTTGTLTGFGVSDNTFQVTNITTDAQGNESVVSLQDTVSGTMHPLVTPILFAPGTFAVPFAYSLGSATSDTGSAYSISFAITGSERVTVPAGTFQAWKVTCSSTIGAVTSNQTQWWAPEIGAFVKNVMVQTDSTVPGQTISTTAVLSSTNVTP